MPFRNILAISLALMLGQAAWAQTPQGGPNPEYVIPIGDDDMVGAGGFGKWCCKAPEEVVTITKWIVKYKSCLNIFGEYSNTKVCTGVEAEANAWDWHRKNCW